MMQKRDGTAAPEILHGWTARKLPAWIPVCVVAIFLGFMAFAWFGIHSRHAVRALAMSMFGVVVPLLPAVLVRVEYRLTGAGLERRMPAGGAKSAFRPVFRWDELEGVRAGRSGFGYRLNRGAGDAPADPPSRRRAAGSAGEIPVPADQREAVHGVFAAMGIAIVRTDGARPPAD